jgi:hypothetical protein
MKKTILTLFIFIFWIGNTFAYNSDDLKTIYYTWSPTRQDIYIIPEGKDFLVQYMYTDSLNNANFGIKDNWQNIIFWAFQTETYNVNFVIKDLLQLVDSSDANHFTITWILVDEGEDISSIVSWNSSWINKKIFDESTILEIYEYEALIMVFILLYTFFMRVTGARQKKKVLSF